MIITDEAVEAAALAEWKTAGMPVPLSETDDECQTRMKDQARAALQAAGPLLIAAELRAQADRYLQITKIGDPAPEVTLFLVAEYRSLRARAAELDGGA